MGDVVRVQVIGSEVTRRAMELLLGAQEGIRCTQESSDVSLVMDQRCLFGDRGEHGCASVLAMQRLALMVPETLDGVVSASTSGALVFVSEEEPVDVVVLSLRMAARGGSSWSPRLVPLVAKCRIPEPVRPPVAPERSLTERELEVALLRAGGCDRKEIAERLSVTEETIKTHLSRIHRKLRVPGADGLASWYSRLESSAARRRHKSA